ncbi:MAG TPA: 1,2-phenylacetyl-CoA epoxidase subunit PaaC [Bacillota bacterium]
MERGEKEMNRIVETIHEAKENRAYLQALKELLYQFADDDFIVSYRGSEWLGLAPHIEADVAFSSITQNTMGHAVMYYRLLEELGEGDSDRLAHHRLPHERRNSVYLEKRNGSGTYLDEPHFDWALAVVRNYFYEVLKRVRLQAATKSSFVPLAQIAEKILMEQTYHLAHWKMWVEQLQQSTEDAKSRIQERIEEAWLEFGDALQLGPKGDQIVQHQLLVDEQAMYQQWMKEIEATLDVIPSRPLGKRLGDGRIGEYTADLEQAISVFAEVYETDREAVW